jgi:hypothetical protein
MKKLILIGAALLLTSGAMLFANGANTSNPRVLRTNKMHTRRVRSDRKLS